MNARRRIARRFVFLSVGFVLGITVGHFARGVLRDPIASAPYRQKARTGDQSLYDIGAMLGMHRDEPTHCLDIARVRGITRYPPPPPPVVSPSGLVTWSQARVRSDTIVLDVIEVLHGTTVPRTLTVEHYHRTTMFGSSMSLTLDMLPGDVWILGCENLAKNRDSFRVATQLDGPNDIVLREYRRNRTWRDRADLVSLYSARALAANQRFSMVARVTALYTMSAIADTPVKFRLRPELRQVLQRYILDEIVRNESPRHFIHTALSVSNIETSSELVPNSPNADLLKLMLKIVVSHEDQRLVAVACDQILQANVQHTTVNGESGYAHYPQIVAALELRQSTDLAEGGPYSEATERLATLDRQGRRHPAIGPPDAMLLPFVVRMIPGAEEIGLLGPCLP